MATKFNLLKHKINERARLHFGEVGTVNANILAEIQHLDRKEELGSLEEEDIL